MDLDWIQVLGGLALGAAGMALSAYVQLRRPKRSRSEEDQVIVTTVAKAAEVMEKATASETRRADRAEKRADAEAARADTAARALETCHEKNKELRRQLKELRDR